MSARSDAELVLAAQAGDADSFLTLCERYYAGMLALAAARLQDSHGAEDVVQETFARACRHLRQLREPAKFASWLAAICRRQVIQARRVAAAEPAREPLDEGEVAAPTWQPAPPVRMVREQVGKLPAPLREVVYLRYYSDLSYDQIAEVLGTTRESVNGRLRRAKRTLGKALGRRLRQEGVIDD